MCIKIFPNETIDALLFYLTNGVGNSDLNVFITAVKDCFLFAIIFIYFLLGLFYNFLFNNFVFVKFDFFKWKIKFQLYPVKLIYKHKILSTIFISLLLITLSCANFKVLSYFKSNLEISNFIEQEYIYPEKVNISFNEKNNLIFIVVESLETSLFTKDQGGCWDYEVIPELYDLMFDKDSTIISALGAKIEGDRIGLGVNLFSDNKTLVEEYGLDYLNEELSKKSLFYNNEILDGNYLKMIYDSNNLK